MIADSGINGTYYCEKCFGFFSGAQLDAGHCPTYSCKGPVRKISDKLPEELWPERKTATHIAGFPNNAVP